MDFYVFCKHKIVFSMPSRSASSVSPIHSPTLTRRSSVRNASKTHRILGVNLVNFCIFSKANG